MKLSVDEFAVKYEEMCKKLDDVVDFLLINELPDVVWSRSSSSCNNLKVMAGELLISTKNVYDLRIKLIDKIEMFRRDDKAYREGK